MICSFEFENKKSELFCIGESVLKLVYLNKKAAVRCQESKGRPQPNSPYFFLLLQTLSGKREPVNSEDLFLTTDKTENPGKQDSNHKHVSYIPKKAE